MDKIRIVDLFAGIGGIRLGFEAAGAECVFSSEIDEDCRKVYERNFGEIPHGDITKIDPSIIPDHEILTAGFPCQPFSICGKKRGFEDTRGTLFFNIEEILRIKQPYAFMLENVKQLKTHDGGKTLQIILQKLYDLGYYVHVKILNALDFGLPQKRERIIIVGFKENIYFEFPNSKIKPQSLETILDYNQDNILFASEQIQNNRLEKVKGKTILEPAIWHENKGGNISILPYSCALRAGASYNYLLVNGKRRLSAREMMRLQGFEDTYEIVVSYQAMRRLTGNSVAVPVIKAVAFNMIKAMNEKNYNLEQAI
jgi:DNA (cytosine-5)-methyltransferase 1